MGEEDEVRKRKRNVRYVPRFRSSNFALLVVLHRRQSEGKEHLGKAELLEEATRGDLCDRPAFRPGERGGGRRDPTARCRGYYGDGWQGFSKLLDGRPPLVIAWSNPRKISLTPDGWEVAKRLHQAAEAAGLCRCEIPTEQGWGSPPAAVTDAMNHARRTGSTRGSRADSRPPFVSDDQTRIQNERGSPDEPGSSSMGGDMARGTFPSSRGDAFSSEPIYEARMDVEALVREELVRIGQRRGKWMAASAAPVDRVALPLPPLGAGEPFPRGYEVVLLIDQRERYCGTRNLCSSMEEFSTMGVRAEQRVLPQGDATWILRHKTTGEEWVTDFVMERKRVDDLFSSIKNKRYEIQKRLIQLSGQTRPMYLIEGDINSMEASAALKTASFTTAVCDGFAVYHTPNVGVTQRLLARITRSIARMYGETVGPSRPGRTLPRYESYKEISENNRRDVTLSQVFGLVLLQVPGIGPETAEAILAEYPTALALYRAYKNALLSGPQGTSKTGSERCAGMLASLPVPGNQSRKVGAVKSRIVYEKLFGSLGRPKA